MKLFPILNREIHLYGVLSIYGVICIFGTIFVFIFFRETKGIDLDEVGQNNQEKSQHI